MSKTLLPIIIVIVVLIALIGIAIGVNNYAAYRSEQRIIHAFSPYYQGLAKQCYSEEEGVSCCLSSVSNMEAKKGVLIPGTGCPEGTRENTLKCVGGYTWCEK